MPSRNHITPWGIAQYNVDMLHHGVFHNISSSLESIHCGWRRLPHQCWKWVLLWLRKPMRENHCLPQSGQWWSESEIGQNTGVCWCLRLRLRAAARSYSSSKYDIPKAQVDLQVAVSDARVFSLLKGMLHFLGIDLMWSVKRSQLQMMSGVPHHCHHLSLVRRHTSFGQFAKTELYPWSLYICAWFGLVIKNSVTF